MDTPAARLEELAQYAVLHQLVAANPATPSAVLARLSEASNPAIRRAVALNPNASVQVLARLAAEFPEEFLRNPLLPILNLTRPAFVKELPFLSWSSLLRFEQLAPSWLQQFKTGSRYQLGWSAIWKLMQLHVSYAGSDRKPLALTPPGKPPRSWRTVVCEELANDQKQTLRPATLDSVDEARMFLLFVLLFPHMASMLKKQWPRVAQTLPRQAGMVLAATTQINRKTLTTLSAGQNLFVRCQVARHPHTSVQILSHLAKSRQAEVRRAVASNPHTPLDTIYTLLADLSSAVRRAAVRHQSLAREDCELMALDEESTVRAALATRPLPDRKLLARLAEDPETLVRAAVARNLHTPREILALLAGDAEPAVRAAAAGNPRLPEELHATLLCDPVEAVRARLSGNVGLSVHNMTSLATDSSLLVCKSLAANPRTPSHLLEQLWQTGEMEIWSGLVRHPRLSPDMLTRMARQGDLRVRAAVVAHKHTPLDVLYELAREDRSEIWSGLAANPHTPLDLLELALTASDADLWLRLFNHPAMVRSRRGPLLALLVARVQHCIATNCLPEWMRRVVLQYYTALPAILLEPFARSPYWEERYLAARHPRLSAELLDSLAHDGICYVRTAAQDALTVR